LQDASLRKQRVKQGYYLPIFDLLTEKTIAGYDIPDTHEDLVNLNAKERVKYRKDLLIEYRYRAGMYIYEAMKKVQGDGCIMAAHQFG